MKRRTAPFARRLDDPHHPQAIHRPLSQRHAATKEHRQLPRAERIRRKRWERRDEVFRPPELNSIEHLDQAPLAWISSPAALRAGPLHANVVLAEQQHLDGQMRMRSEATGRQRACRTPPPHRPALASDEPKRSRRPHRRGRCAARPRPGRRSEIGVRRAARRASVPAPRNPPSGPRLTRHQPAPGRSRSDRRAPPTRPLGRPTWPLPQRAADPRAPPRCSARAQRRRQPGRPAGVEPRPRPPTGEKAGSSSVASPVPNPG